MDKNSKIFKDLTYEIDMYRQARQTLIKYLKKEIVLEDYLRFVIIESFAAHNRVLIEFFYPNDKIHQDDVLAKHFIEDWDNIRVPITPTPIMQLARTKASKQLAHLTYSRVTRYDDVDKKSWLDIVISDDLDKVINLFLNTLNK